VLHTHDLRPNEEVSRRISDDRATEDTFLSTATADAVAGLSGIHVAASAIPDTRAAAGFGTQLSDCSGLAEMSFRRGREAR
jgi:hypothetical protein